MMVRKKVRRKVFSVLLAAVMAFGMTPAAAFGAEGGATTGSVSQFADMPDNWSAKALQNAVANGLLSGADGRIMPEQNLTRAQMAAVITRAFGAQIKGDLSGFSDVKAADRFSDSLSKAYQMGVIKGSDGLMNPNGAISRQEVFVILARAFKLQPAETMGKPFIDSGSIADWAKGEVYAFVNAGYVQGSDGKLNPTGLITRAEFAQIFDNLIKQYINTAGEYDQVAEGNIMINTPAVSLKNLKVAGDLIIGDGVGDGEVILDSVAVTGRLVIRGGGENSIIIKGSSSVSKVVVARVDGAVSVKVEGDADVEVVYIDDGSDDVSVQGTIGTLEVTAPEIVVKTVNATITRLDVAGEGAKVVVEAGSKIETAAVRAQNTEISGTGSVKKVEVQAGGTGSKIETPNTQISVGAGVTGVTAAGGQEVGGGETVTTSDDGKSIVKPTAPPPSSDHHDNSTPTVSVGGISFLNATTVTFYCNAAPSKVVWNSTEVQNGNISYNTSTQAVTITVPVITKISNTLTVSASGYSDKTDTASVAASAGNLLLISDTSQLLAAAANQADGQSWIIKAGAYELTEQLNFNKVVILTGDGAATVRAKTGTTWKTDNSSKHLIGIYAGTASSPVKFENITFDANSISCGLNTYNNAYGVLKDVTIKNSRNAALIVNGSTIEADNLNTENNAWGAVNVDPGSGVTIPSKLVLTGSGTLTEEKQIWSDGDNVKASAPNATVTVSAGGYDEYRIYDSVKDKDGNLDNDDNYIWTNRDLKNTIVLEKATVSKNVIYPDIYAAVDDAVAGDTVLVEEGTYNLASALTIDEAITVKGADKHDTTLIGTCRFTSGSPGATITLNGGATLENVTIKRDNTGDWDTNYNNSLISLSSLTASTTVQDCIITQGRNGIYMNNTYKIADDTVIPNILNNVITDNRTGINFCGDCSHAKITGNTITDNWTIGIVHYNTGSAGTALDTITLEDNTIKDNWIAQILIKTPQPTDADSLLITGLLKISYNDFGGPVTDGIQTVTVATQYNSEKAEPAYTNQRPKSVGGTTERPDWEPPAIRIYKQPNAGITGSGIQLDYNYKED